MELTDVKSGSVHFLSLDVRQSEKLNLGSNSIYFTLNALQRVVRGWKFGGGSNRVTGRGSTLEKLSVKNLMNRAQS